MTSETNEALAGTFQPPSPPRRRFSFSLRAFVAFLIIVSLVIAQIGTSRRLYLAERELGMLRREAGHLVVDDRSKIHVIAIPTLDSMTWQWRIYLPEGHKYYLHERYNQIPEIGRPTNDGNSGMRELAAGEQKIAVSVRRNHRGEWSWILASERASSTRGLSEAEMQWMLKSDLGFSTSQCGVGGAIKPRDPGEPLELLRLLVQINFPPGAPPADPKTTLHDGFLIWLTSEPEPASPAPGAAS